MKSKYEIWIICILPALWVAGIHVNDLARLFSLILLTLLVWKHSRILAPKIEQTSYLKVISSVFLSFLGFFSLFLLTEPLLSVYRGSHGIDFAIFTQVVDSIIRFDYPLSSLVSMAKINFMSHHLVPFLYFPAIFTKLGMPAYSALSLVHSIFGVATGIGFYLLARKAKFNRFLSLTLCTLLFANPSMRHGLFYGVHDEIFALPFLAFALVFWLSRRIVFVCILLLLAATTKESLSPVGIAIITMIILDDRFVGKRDRRLTDRQTILLLATASVLLCAFAGYVFFQPWFFGKNFDHMSKLVSIGQLASPSALFEKLLFLWFLVLPILFFPILAWRQWHLFLPVAPLLGIIIVSNFKDMWAPLNYYGVVPTFLIYSGSIIALSRWEKVSAIFQSRYMIALIICISFSWSTKKPMKTIVNFFRLPTYSATQLAMIPSDASVISSPAGAIFLLRVNDLWRLGNATLKNPENFDFLVKKLDDNEKLEPDLASRVALCFSDSNWQIYCSKSGLKKLTLNGTAE